jgi:hypothetical protein
MPEAPKTTLKQHLTNTKIGMDSTLTPAYHDKTKQQTTTTQTTPK